MRIGIYSSNADVGAIVERCCAAGVDSVTLDPGAVPGFAQTGALDAASLRAIVGRLDDAGIQVPAMFGSIGANPDAVLDPGSHRGEIDRSLSMIRAMGEAGIGVLINYVHTPEPEDPAEDAALWEGLVRLFQEHVAEAESSNVRLANHGIWKCLPEPLRTQAIRQGVRPEDYRRYREEGWIGPFLVRTVDAIQRIIEAVPHPSNGVCFCTGMYITGAQLEEEIERLRDRIHFVQIRDIGGGRWPHSDEVFPGTGDLNFLEIIRRLLESGYDGYAHAEHLGKKRLPAREADQRSEAWELEIAAASYVKAMVEAAGRIAEGRALARDSIGTRPGPEVRLR